jgi:hypothetical protein
MQLNSILILLFLSLPLQAQVDRSIRTKSQQPQFDLIQESNSLAVLQESTVQSEEPVSRHVITFLAGAGTAKSLQLTSNNHIVSYDLSAPQPFLGASLGYYPAHFGGYWGLTSSINYTWLEQNTATDATALHILNGDILLSYRFETSTRSYFKPFAGVGPGINLVFQRGIDEVNTSEAHGIAVGMLGVGINLKRILGLTSPLDWEFTAQYKRWIDTSSSNANFNGGLVSVGLSMIL